MAHKSKPTQGPDVPATIAEDAFFIDRNANDGLQLQLRQSVAASILSGRLRVGDRLPSSRKLANHLNISRITVTLAFQELAADGYLESRSRSGYFVAETAPVARIKGVVSASAEPGIAWTDRITRPRTHSLRVEKTLNWRDFRYPFVYGQADPTIFNHSAWRACAHRALGQKDFHTLAGDYVGDDDPELIDFIARHTLPRRGIAAQPDQILITLGAQNALWIVSQLLLDPSRHATIEDPGYPGLRDILTPIGCGITPLPVDEHGIPPDAIPAGTNVVFATPSHQAPTTVTMPMDRRRAFLQAAVERDFIVVEDDYDFELSFLKPPYPALKSMDPSGRVIYVGSFSKSLFPGLRLGYLVADRDFIEEARHLRTTVLRHPPGHIQRTTAYFLGLGHYDALIRRMRDVFQERRRIMMDHIDELGLNALHSGVFGGTSIWMRAPDHVDTQQLAARLRPRGVLFEPGAPFFFDADGNHSYFRLAYSSIPRERIADGLAVLAREIQSV